MRARANGVVYCRVPHQRAADQTPVDERQRACRRLATELDVSVPSRRVFLDVRANAWQGARSTRAWDDMLTAARDGTVTVLFVYGIEDLAHHAPSDAADLLHTCRTCGLKLYDPSNERDWNDPDIRRGVEDAANRARQAAQNAATTARRIQDGQVQAGLRKPRSCARCSRGSSRASR